MADEQIVTNIVANADFSNLSSELRRVTAQLSALQDQANSTNKALANQISVMNRQFGDTLRSTGQFTSHFVTIGSDVEKFGKNLDAGRGKLRDFYGAWQQHHKQAGGLIRDLAKQQVQLQNSILQPLGRNADGMMKFAVHVPQGLDTIKNKTALAKQELMIMNKVVQEGANQLINWGKNTQWAGRQLTVGLTVPMVAFGKAAADSFRAADEQLTRLTKVYGDLAQTSSSQLRQVREDVSATARELASTMGASYKDTLALSADIAATGKTGDELLGSIRETTRLSILGEVDRQDAMKATLAIQSAFKQNTDELSQSINFLNAVENQTSTSLNDLVEAIPKAGPVIKGLGGSVQDLALYLTAMREGGINATEGANALKSGLASLINPTKVAVGTFKGFGIDLLGIVNSNAGNVTGTLLELQKALDTLDPLAKQQAIEQLFGKFQFSRMNALFENLGKQGSQTLRVLELMKASSSELSDLAGRELSQVTESASGKYRRALEELKADLAVTGEQFLKISTYILKFVDKIVDFANNLPGPIKTLLGFFGSMTAIAGPLIMLTGVLGNFFGYIIKGVSHFKALFSSAEGWRLLTPEIVAANNAGDLAAKTFYSDTQAAQVLNQALRDLSAQYDALAVKASSGAVSVAPILNNIAEQAVAGQRVVDPNNPLAGPMGTRASAHMVPRKVDQPRSIFGLVPSSVPVNAAIGENPMIYSQGDMPSIAGLTTINATRTIGGRKQTIPVSTGVVAGEAARHHAYMAALGMQSKQEFEALKKTIAITGTTSKEFMDLFDDILPITSQLTAKAATQSAGIVAELKAGKLSVAQAREQIIALNLAIEKEMGVAVSAYAANAGRSINLMNVPTLNQPVQSTTGKSNMRELFKSRQGGIFSRIAESIGVRTSGAGYNIQTTRPKRFATGVVGINKIFGSTKRMFGASKMLKNYSSYSSMFSGWRTPNLRPAKIDPSTGKLKRKSGSSTNKTAEKGLDITYANLSDRKSKIFNDPWLKEAGITPTVDGQYLVHGYTPAYYQRTKGLEFTTKGIAKVPSDRRDEFGFGHIKTSAPYMEVLPNSFIKGTQNFNEILDSGRPVSEAWTPVSGSDMISLMLFLKSQGKSPSVAKQIAQRAANTLNSKMAAWGNRPMSEAEFGKILNNSSVRGLRSGFINNMVERKDHFGYDKHTTYRGSVPNPAIATEMGLQNGVTKLPGFGGGDIIPAMLEPGESVITKTATSGNEKTLSLLNQGFPMDKALGLKKGKVKVGKQIAGSGMGSTIAGMGLQSAGYMVGGNMGTALMMGGTLMQMTPMLAPLMKAVSGVKNLSGLMTGLGSIATKVGTGLRAAFTFMTGPVGIALAGVTALTAAFLILKKRATDAGAANRLAFGGTERSFASVGIKDYTSLSDKLKAVNEQMELHKAQVLSTYNSYTKAKPNGLTLTIKELNDAIKNAKKNQTEYVEGFNNIDSSRVNEYATSLKSQFVAMGMSASDATNQIYAIIKASDKSGQAVEAISTKTFVAIQKNTDGIKVMTKGLEKTLTKDFNAEEYARGLDTLLNSAIKYKNSLVGTKGENKEIRDEADALAITMKEITKNSSAQNKLSADQLSQLKSQDVIYASILGTNENLQSITAKILLYQSGISNIVNLSKMGADETVAFANNLSSVQNIYNSITERSSSNPLSSLSAYIEKASKANQAAAATAKKAKQADDEYYTNKIKLIDKAIEKVQEEADARLKLLDIEQERVDYNNELSKAKLAYEQAVASGDFAQAAQEQLNLTKLIGDRQRDLASQDIEDRAQKEIDRLNKEKERLQDERDRLNNNYQKIQANAAQKAASLAEAQAMRDEIEAIAIRSRGQKPSDTDVKSISNILQKMKTSGSKELKDAALEMEKNNPAQGAPPAIVGGRPSSGSVAESLVNNLNKQANLDSANNKTFSNAVKAFDEAVRLYRGETKIGKKGTSGMNLPWYPGASGSAGYTGGFYNKATGGYISGPGTGTSDSIPAMLSNGEYVINARSVANVGIPALDRINKFAAGGLATTYKMPSAKSYARINMSEGGYAGLSSSMYNVNVTLNGSDMNPQDVAREIEKQLRLREAMNGRSVIR